MPKHLIPDRWMRSKGGRLSGLTPEERAKAKEERLKRLEQVMLHNLAVDNLETLGTPIPDHLKDDENPNEAPGSSIPNLVDHSDYGESQPFDDENTRLAEQLPGRLCAASETSFGSDLPDEMTEEDEETTGEQYRVTWIDICDCAQSLFKVWHTQPELRWAQKAWTALEANGLTTYQTELERYVVLIRLLVLADFYGRFCRDAFEQSFDDTDRYLLCDELISFAEFSPFRIGQLVGEDFVADEDEEGIDDSDLVHQAVLDYAKSLRSETIRSLVNYFGSPEALFVSLRLSTKEVETVCPDPERLYLAGAEYLEVEAWENFWPRRFKR